VEIKWKKIIHLREKAGKGSEAGENTKNIGDKQQ
jgi:hypothetical protein